MMFLTIVFIIIIVVCVVFLRVHRRLIKKWDSIEALKLELENIIRLWMDELLDVCETSDDDLSELCELYRDAEQHELFSAYFTCKKILKGYIIDEISSIDDLNNKINELSVKLNVIIEAYNNELVSIPGIAAAKIFLFEKEELWDV